MHLSHKKLLTYLLTYLLNHPCSKDSQPVYYLPAACTFNIVFLLCIALASEVTTLQCFRNLTIIIRSQPIGHRISDIGNIRAYRNVGESVSPLHRYPCCYNHKSNRAFISHSIPCIMTVLGLHNTITRPCSRCNITVKLNAAPHINAQPHAARWCA